ncbi:winged helix-turn-helix domain-containing protein [Streptomyces sp. MST-110588]|uniref:ArsR/SmtB family transcription factor n=1 Tax=Streptomyces sp. MST-110588 TaxID=2833628 RepID=UPI001F5DB692|nr:winged helix-turn-helix domain-containing protein [Streptomyces sp. MST-110588]UNO41177.1 helix-turn-helix transcriptional regulator [Streptomyces sp. MST-110588]
MDLEERVAELERRLAALEERRADGAGDKSPAPGQEGDELWALTGLKAQFAQAGTADGGVLFTGSVRLPQGQHYEWQYGLTTQTLLGQDWTPAADAFAALGQPVRLRLLHEILGGRATAAELSTLEEVGTTGQIYHHLRQLTAAGWLHTVSRGHYEVPASRVVPLLVMLTATRH